MKNVLGFELRKIAKERFFWIFFTLLILGNLFCIYLHEKSTPEYHYIYEQRTSYEEFANGNTEVDWDGFYQQDMERQKEYAKTYKDFLNGMTGRADELKSLSTFSEKKSFVYRNVEKTCADFAPLSSVRIEQDNCFGVGRFVRYAWGIFFYLIFLAFLSYKVFFQERNLGLFLLLKCTKKGHVPFVLAKLGTMLLYAMAYFFLQELSSIVLFRHFYGFGRLGRSVQSVLEFRNCPLQMTVGGLLAGTVIERLFVAIFLILLLFAISVLIRNELLAILLVGSFLAAEFGMYRGIELGGSFGLFKSITVFLRWNPQEWFGTYCNLNVFGYAVGKESLTNVVMIAAAVVLLGIGILGFHFSYQIQTKSRLERVQLWIRKKTGFLWRHASIIRFEWSKVFTQQKKGWILLFLLVICISQIKTVTGNQYYSTYSEAIYHSYLDRIHGKVTEESIQFVEEEKEALQEMEQQLLKLSDSTNGKDMFLAQQLKLEYESKSEAMDMIWAQLEGLKQKEGSIYEKYWVDERAYLQYFYDVKTDILLGVAGLYALLFCLSGIFPFDEKKKMMSLLGSTYSGREKLYQKKNVCAAIGTGLLFLLTELPIGIRYLLIDNGDAFGQKMSDLTLVFLHGSLTIGSFLILAFLLKILLFAGTACIVVIMSRKLKNETITNVIGIALIGMSALILYYFQTDISTGLLRLLW